MINATLELIGNLKFDELQAGRDLDRIISEVVMGWKIGQENGTSNTLWLNEAGEYALGMLWFSYCSNWMPSTDIVAAWRVTQFFEGYDWKLESTGSGFIFTIYKDATHYTGESDSAPLAICRSALKAVLAK